MRKHSTVNFWGPYKQDLVVQSNFSDLNESVHYHYFGLTQKEIENMKGPNTTGVFHVKYKNKQQ